MKSKYCKIFFTAIFTFAFFALLSCSKQAPAESTSLPKVILSTELGDIIIEADTINAPVTANNFLRYVDNKLFYNASFYRVVRMDNQPSDSIKIEVIQGGLGFEESPLSLPPIKHETTIETGILHRDATISMARDEPGSASSEFFICIGNQPELDYEGMRNPDGQGFAAFGKVIKGMNVVKKIQSQKDKGQMLINPVLIKSAYRFKVK
jgi:peptidyl-prolyl cis-trans isomerase A (cyclophilin A)